MKKLFTVLAFALAIPGMAAQKNCGDVFPNDGVKSSMGLDGAKCVQSKMKNPNGDVTIKVKVSKDNATFKFKMEGTLFYADGSKKPTDTLIECEDVGRGISWECSFKALKNGKWMTENKTLGVNTIYSSFFALLSAQDQNYLFNGYLPWAQGDY